MSKTIYQLVASGRMALFDRSNKIYSKNVFRNKQDAIKFKPEFKISCETPINDHDLVYLEDCNVSIVELELS